jgi:sodium-dependent dicarboxylate transporter 2/3/5
MRFEILTPRNTRRIAILALALLAGYVISRFRPEGLTDAGRLTLGIFTTAAILWVVEPFPLYVTSFIVVILEVILLGRPGGPLGLTGSGYTVFLHPFFDSVIVLVLGGYVLATAIKRYGLDGRLSQGIMRRAGTRPKFVLLAMMATAAFLSMWISNTAATALMIAVAIPIVISLDADDPFRIAMMLGIPFASNIGGMATPIGTAPNAIAIGLLANMGREMRFVEWMYRGVPVSAILLVICWLVLCRLFPPRVQSISIDFEEQGKIGRKPLFVLGVFAVVVFFWLTTGWHGIPSSIVALFPLVVFFGLRLLKDEDLQDLGWGILFTIGGGMSLGAAMRLSGLSAWIVGQMPIGGMPMVIVLLVFALGAAVMTSFIANSATANLLLPIVVGISSISPATSAVVVALAASAAMVLPISTPPNAIAYGSGYFSVRDMARAGILVTGAAVILVTLFIYALF